MSREIMNDATIVPFPGDVSYPQFTEIHHEILQVLLNADISVVAALGILETVKYEVLNPPEETLA